MSNRCSQDKIAMPYSYSDSLKRYLPYGHGGYPDYPAGQLRTSIEQLASSLIEWTTTKAPNTAKPFEDRTIQTLTPNRFVLGFHTWNLSGLAHGDILYSHAGGDNGINSFIRFNPYTKRGVMLFMNGEVTDFKYLDQLINVILLPRSVGWQHVLLAGIRYPIPDTPVQDRT